MDPRLDLVSRHIRDIPDFPKPGILFRDITPVLTHPPAFRAVIDLLVERYRTAEINRIVAVESRGFIFGGTLALELNLPLHLVRKQGKLPWKTDQISYSLEYGKNVLEIQRDELEPGNRVLLLDDLLATGGTVAATAELVTRQGAEAVEAAFVIELSALGGSERLAPLPCFSLLRL